MASLYNRSFLRREWVLLKSKYAYWLIGQATRDHSMALGGFLICNHIALSREVLSPTENSLGPEEDQRARSFEYRL